MKSKKLKVKRTKTKERSVVETILLVFCFLFFGISAQAQCAMCRASLESSGDVTQAQAVNDGIVYLMVIPYILVALIGFAIYRMFQKKKEI